MRVIKAFIFDIGDVLLEVDYAAAINRLLGDKPIDRVAVDAMIHTAKIELETGHVDTATFAAQVMAGAGFSGTRSEFEQIWCDIFAVHPPTSALVARLKPHYPLYLLSNTSGLHINFVKREFPLFGQFDDAVYSDIAGCMKPAPAIYQQAIDQFGVLPEETVFIDDLSANIATAKGLGFQTFHYAFDRHAALLEWLTTQGVMY